MDLRLILVAALAWSVEGVKINNEILGDPEVQCGPTSVQLSFQSTAPFIGMVYAKNHFANQDCRVGGEGIQGGGLETTFETCGVRRFRSVDPRGIYVRTTIVVQFHPFVLTKSDRAFNIECFYMEADKTVDQELEVSMVTTELRTFMVPMPTCRYEILENDEDGQAVRFVRIGDKIFHKWTCDTETTDTFCMEVYSCTVDDGSVDALASQLQLVDELGCSTDKNLLDNIGYANDLMGGVQTHVFKYADRPQLYFNCQIRIAVKEPNSECVSWREVDGACADPQETTGRKKRSALDERRNANTVDVAPASLYIADIDLTFDEPEASGAELPFLREPSQPSSAFCLSPAVVSVGATVVGVVGVVAIVLTIFFAFRTVYRK